MNQFSTVVPMEVPGAFREFAEKGVNQARENYDRFKVAADSANGAIEAVYSAATQGATTYNTKLLEIARTNTNAMFDLASSLLGVTSLAQATELFSAHSKSQFEAFTAQAKELTELGQKVAADTVEPIKNSTSNVFRQVA